MVGVVPSVVMARCTDLLSKFFHLRYTFHQWLSHVSSILFSLGRREEGWGGGGEERGEREGEEREEEEREEREGEERGRVGGGKRKDICDRGQIKVLVQGYLLSMYLGQLKQLSSHLVPGRL